LNELWQTVDEKWRKMNSTLFFYFSILCVVGIVVGMFMGSNVAPL
jgi:cytochrome bd-type quinol oxidase subunit 1